MLSLLYCLEQSLDWGAEHKRLLFLIFRMERKKKKMEQNGAAVDNKNKLFHSIW